MRIDAIKPFEANAKKHDRVQINNVAQSIKEFGFIQPIVVDRNGVVIIGHCRLEALKQLSYSEIPDDWVKVLDADEERCNKLRLLDNKLNESEWDLDLLAMQIPEIDFTNFDIDWGLPETSDLPEQTEDDYEAPADLPSFVHRGDIWQLGDHRLMCGDSTAEDDVLQLMGGATADMLVTDPPYNVALGQSGGHALRPSEAKQMHRRQDGLTIDNDSWESDEEFVKFLEKAFKNALTSLKPGGVYYIWYADTQAVNFRNAAKRTGLEVRQNLIWNKNIFTLGRQDYQWKHEPCLYGWKEGAAHYFIDDRRQSTVFEDKVDLKKLKKDEAIRMLKEILEGNVSTTVLDEDKPSVSKEHPTMKPVKLFARQIKNSSLAGQIVLDLFGGSGTTIIACEELKRRAFVMEYDEHYASVIVDRWQQFTGKTAKKLN